MLIKIKKIANIISRNIYSTIFIFGVLSLVSCGNNNKIKQGELRYNQKISTENHFRVIEGEGIVMRALLDSKPSPKGVDDGGTEVRFLMHFPDSSFLETNKTYELPTNDFRIYVIFSGNAIGKPVPRENVLGTITINKYEAGKGLNIAYDLIVNNGDGSMRRKFKESNIWFLE